MRSLSLFCALALCAILVACSNTLGNSVHPPESTGTTLARSSTVRRPVSGSCGVLDVVAEGSELIPGAPCAIVLSRYRALQVRPGTRLVGRAEIRSAPLLRQLTSEFDALPPAPKGAFACPNDNGSHITASLKYAHHRVLQLTVAISGCPEARRELVVRSALGHVGAKLIGQLERLTARL
jgi:hypothetical protein